MKVILSVESLSRELTGVGRYTLELARRLPEALCESDELRFHHQQRWLDDPLRLLSEPIPSIYPSQRLPLWVRNIRRRALRASWRQQCRSAIFHGPNYFLPHYADKGVVTIHDMSVLRHPEWHPTERVRQHEKLLQSSLERSQRLIAVSESTRDEIVALLGYPAENIDVTPLATGPAYRPREANDTEMLMRRIGLRHAGFTLCVATLEPRKNIANLIHAYARLPAGLRLNYPLVLAGSRGWNSQEIYDLIEKYSKQGWLRYLGYISEAELPVLYSAARILAYPSWYEGFGLPVLEAMASGVPVVASDRTSLPELTHGHALHVPPGDTHALESAIGRALEDNSWRQEVIVNALNTAATYSWDNCIQSTLSTYRKLG